METTSFRNQHTDRLGHWSLCLLLTLLAISFLTACPAISSSTDLSRGDLEVHFIDVGQGEAIFIRTAMHHVLIDGGSRGEAVPNYLARQGVVQLDLVIATHPHADHIGGLINVLHQFPVLEVIDPAVPHTTRTFEEYLTLIDDLNIPFTEGRAGMTRELGGATLELLHPVDPSSRDLNDASIVARLSYGAVHFLFTGDAEAPSEYAMLSRSQDLRSTVLKVGHHGSHSSTTQEFLRAVDPEIAVIMCGVDNTYGHPHDVVLTRLEAAGIPIYRTDLHGSIVIHTDGINYEVSHPGQQAQYQETNTATTDRIDLNNADLETLQGIIHIGEERAREIIRLRPFNSIDELTRINGIGAGRLREIREEGKAWVQ